MSLMSATKPSDEFKALLMLRTPDQYTIWKARVGDACCATHKSIFDVTDQDCAVGLKEYDDNKKKSDAVDWVGKCWMIITGSLHDDIYSKVSHVQRGCIQSLLEEVSQALVVNNMEEVQPLLLMAKAKT